MYTRFGVARPATIEIVSRNSRKGIRCNGTALQLRISDRCVALPFRMGRKEKTCQSTHSTLGSRFTVPFGIPCIPTLILVLSLAGQTPLARAQKKSVSGHAGSGFPMVTRAGGHDCLCQWKLRILDPPPRRTLQVVSAVVRHPFSTAQVPGSHSVQQRQRRHRLDTLTGQTLVRIKAKTK